MNTCVGNVGVYNMQNLQIGERTDVRHQPDYRGGGRFLPRVIGIPTKSLITAHSRHFLTHGHVTYGISM